VLAAARVFRREKFGSSIATRWCSIRTEATACHLVVKAESSKASPSQSTSPCCALREDFAQMMRDQGVRERDSNMYRGRTRAESKTRCNRAQRRKRSTVMRARVESIANELHATGRVVDPNHSKLEQTRKAVVTQWKMVADVLDSRARCVGRRRALLRDDLPRVQTDRDGWPRSSSTMCIDGGRTQSESKTRRSSRCPAKARASDQTHRFERVLKNGGLLLPSARCEPNTLY